MTTTGLKDKSKFLSLVLRHKPEKLGLHMDGNGWVEVSEIVEKSDITLEELKSIVADNDKKRFSFSDDETKIRANQGHSIDVDLQLKAAIPPFVLYHGTGEKSIDVIFKDGIKKMNRQHVHLSIDMETAIKVGSRHGKHRVIEVRARAMHTDGIKFYLSENGVWLTDYVDIKYFE